MLDPDDPQARAAIQAADLAMTCPYPHIPALVAELVAYEAARKP